MELSEADRIRFWSKVDRRGPDECWPWTNARMKRGYGVFGMRNTTVLAHRIAWTLAHDTSPPSALKVCHTCDNPPCVNPAHLFLGTQADNLRDMREKGRGVDPPRQQRRAS